MLRRAWRLHEFTDYFDEHYVQLPLETVDGEAIAAAVFPVLLRRRREGATEGWLRHVVAAFARRAAGTEATCPGSRVFVTENA